MNTTRIPVVAALATLACVAGLPAQTIAITGGTVYPVSGPVIEHGTVLMRDGRIVAVGANVAVPEGAERIDATGKIVTPGFVNAGTQLGLVEVGSGAGTRETNPRTPDGIAAAARSWDGLNPQSVMIAPAREGGVTSVVSLPAGGLIAGQAAFLDLVDGTAPDMLVRAPAVMVAQVGSDDDADVGNRGQLMARLRTFIEDTRYYASHRAEFDRGQSRSLSAGRADLDAMIPVVQGRVPLLVEADKSSDILAAIALGREYGLKVMIAGGAEAWMVARDLAAAKVPVLAGAMMNIPYAFTALGSRQDNVALLRKAGVEVALVGNAGGGDEELFNVRNIRFEAGNAVGYGMSRDDALRAVTLGPALIFGVADRVGSLSAGREANVVVWDGDPFEFASHAGVVFVRGRRYQDHSRQDQLTDRYKTLPPAYQKP